MRKHNRTTRFLTFSLITICVVCIAVFGFLVKYMNRQSATTINQLVGIYMSGMNERISKHFETMVDLRLTQIQTLVDTIPIENDSDSEELRDWLEYGCEARDFNALAYYMDDGRKCIALVAKMPIEYISDTLSLGDRKLWCTPL